MHLMTSPVEACESSSAAPVGVAGCLAAARESVLPGVAAERQRSALNMLARPPCAAEMALCQVCDHRACHRSGWFWSSAKLYNCSCDSSMVHP